MPSPAVLLLLIGFALCHLSSELLWQEPPNCFLCFEIIPSFPYLPRAFRFQSCFMKTKIVSYHFPIFKPFLSVLCTFEVAKTSAGATHKQVIQGREEQQVEDDGDLYSKLAQLLSFSPVGANFYVLPKLLLVFLPSEAGNPNFY